ncbi:MAG: nucleotidyltransferase domain-containing protein [Bryobacterales bacterium]|nr:nucleotidyltransferase domain-containing protein [Bryobacterales bacterium]
MERVLKQLVERLTKTFEQRLVSVVLYGSAAAGDHHGRFSDINILCVLSQVTPRELGESEPIFRWWREHGNPAPLLLSRQEVNTCTDCFAIEFHDIKSRHRILHGEDVVDGLPIDDSFYRAQVEYELRAKLLRLRQKASGVLSDRDLLRQLLVDSVSTFCVLFRHALVLHGVEARYRKREVIEQAREAFGIGAAAFEKVLDVREERAKPKELDPVPLLEQYLEAITGVIDAVDRLEK